MEGETIYNSHDDSHIVMSEKVQSLAGSIYQEFERMIAKYDEDVVKDLMPLIVNILECLDLSYTENQEHEVEVELLREDNEQLVTQYEREKQLRKASEQKLLEIEDAHEEDRKQSQAKTESLESIVRMFELKNKNVTDQAARMEEKVEERKQEYSKLHERYTELFRAHMDYMERTKILMGADRIDQLPPSRARLPSLNMANLNRSSGPVSFGFSSLDPNKSLSSPVEPMVIGNFPAQISSIRKELNEAQSGPDVPYSLGEKNEIIDFSETKDKVVSGAGWVDGFSASEVIEEGSPEFEDLESMHSGSLVGPDLKPKSTTTTQKEERTGNTLYQELQFQESDLNDADEGADVTGGFVHPGDYSSSITDNFFGMGKEVENLIKENNELLETKNALNIVKDDLIAKVDELTSEQEILNDEIKSLGHVKVRLQQRISELEEELKKTKEELEKSTKSNKSDDDEDVPMAQRKRFTRVEMARVLMERNQYKERFMELQEAVRWTEMIRASRIDPGDDKKAKQTIWKFFSNLFSSPEKPPSRALLYSGNGGGGIRYNAPSHQVTPALDAMRRKNLFAPDHVRRRGLEIFDSAEISSEKMQQRRATERREQYKQVRAHVRKDDGRLQAYGWSLPAKVPARNSEGSSSPHISLKHGYSMPVPVPVYCRPLMEKEPGMKIWCAAGVNLTGGRTKDGGSIVGASVFYSLEDGKNEVGQNHKFDIINQLDQELQESENARLEGESLEQSLSSLVWICTSTHSISKVTVIDANNPADVLESFHVCSSHLLCIASVPGAKELDYSSEQIESNVPVSIVQSSVDITVNSEKEFLHTDSPSEVGTLSFISCGTGSETTEQQPESPNDREIVPVLRVEKIVCTNPELDKDRADIGNKVNEHPPLRRLLKEPEGVIKDGMEEHEASCDAAVVTEEIEKMSSVMPTMWLGSQSGSIYVHSAVRQWKSHVKGRVLAALADGTVAIFHRAGDGQWDLTNYHLLDLGKPHHSIRCMQVVYNTVWCGYRNKIHIVDPCSMTVEKSFDAHPRKESQVRQMAWVGEGVWVSIRLDSTLRMYHANTYQHLQDVDIEPYVSKMLGTGKLGFSFVRITALIISSYRLWIGTGNGVIISVPLSESTQDGCSSISSQVASGHHLPGGVVRVYSDPKDNVHLGSFIPYCSMASAQLSFHGHRDAVKFFVAVPGHGGCSPPLIHDISEGEELSSFEALPQEKPKSMLIMSGGEGYVDFRLGETDDEGALNEDAHSLSHGEQSHLIVWSVNFPTFGM